ncbi:ferrous iron transport protein B [Desulfobulbus alkaliphilus]|uniref:ferrous iron transport protein B n=1 Tax=Desulfobulbus alkaliphilus TaxID=869814 RepID=UPI001962FB51|nr:ferrous iron transport protein B [Desulfobulbus alkaliphilus]MBM9538827.1 ferrous iron transport protein B [Desulfobulbus alkaliphilus]
MQIEKKLLVGLAGQQNAGKSTVFNMLTGAHQHVANYPGVTVDKKYGLYRHEGVKVELVDLPGTYSLTSFSLEERVARDFLITTQPDVLINVVDASSLKRSLYFTFQILEMGFPVVVALNMMDVAARNGLRINVERLRHRLGVDVVPTVGRKGKGKKEVRDAVLAAAQRKEGKALEISYEELEPAIGSLHAMLERSELVGTCPLRWLAVKLVEGDSEAEKLLIGKLGPDCAELAAARKIRGEFEASHYMSVGDYLVGCRDRLATSIIATCVKETREGRTNITEAIDAVVLNRFAAPFILIATVFVIYQLSIVKGYDLTQYWWPFLAKFRAMTASALPDAGLLHDPYIRSMGLWMVDSANALLNYIPIFLILFSLIAILEDSGYMARIAFILDKMFHAFGLHGQSTLPFILGGVFAGGCAVPGVMATKGIPDEQSRMATILTVPYMNCLAKIPFYTLLVNVFFVQYRSWVMLFLSTITIFMALLVARLLTLTVLRGKETAPFVMELPNYHPPTLFGVGQRALERTWQYIKKVGTIVIAVSICVFTLLQFPGLGAERVRWYENEMAAAVANFHERISASAYAGQLQAEEDLVRMLNLYSEYRAARLNLRSPAGAVAMNERFERKDPDLFLFLRPGTDEDAQIISRALRSLASQQVSLRRQIKEEQIESSFLGMIGRGLEPVTQWAGFNWKINVAILSSFVARESSVATIGVLYQQGADDNLSLEERMAAETREGGFTPLHALAIILFFALYPPCLATTIMIKVQTGSYGWMLFSILFPTALGFAVASAVFTGGGALGLSGIQMMALFYGTVVTLALVVGLYGARGTPSLGYPDPADRSGTAA